MHTLHGLVGKILEFVGIGVSLASGLLGWNWWQSILLGAAILTLGHGLSRASQIIVMASQQGIRILTLPIYLMIGFSLATGTLHLLGRGIRALVD